MDVKEAVRAAKSFVKDSHDGEELLDLGLEEIIYEDSDQTWNITIGFSRPWGLQRQHPLGTVAGGLAPYRDYRVVKIREADGKVLSETIREMR